MASFKIDVDGTLYNMEFTRDSVRKFEQSGGSLEGIKSQLQLTTDRLFTIGIMAPAENLMNANLAAKVLEKALDEYGLDEVYSTVVEPFLEVFTQAGKQTGKKSMRVIPNQTK